MWNLPYKHILLIKWISHFSCSENFISSNQINLLLSFLLWKLWGLYVMVMVDAGVNIYDDSQIIFSNNLICYGISYNAYIYTYRALADTKLVQRHWVWWGPVTKWRALISNRGLSSVNTGGLRIKSGKVAARASETEVFLRKIFEIVIF